MKINKSHLCSISWLSCEKYVPVCPFLVIKKNIYINGCPKHMLDKALFHTYCLVLLSFFFFFSSFLLYPQFACHLIQRPHTNGKPIIHPFLTWTFTGILPRHFLAWHTMHASAHFCTWIGKPNLILISRLVDMKITFNLKGINLQTVRSRELPDCYSFSVTVWLKLILAHDWVQKAEKWEYSWSWMLQHWGG